MTDEKVAVLLPYASISAADTASYGQPTNCSMTAFKLFAKSKKGTRRDFLSGFSYFLGYVHHAVQLSQTRFGPQPFDR